MSASKERLLEELAEWCAECGQDVGQEHARHCPIATRARNAPDYVAGTPVIVERDE